METESGEWLIYRIEQLILVATLREAWFEQTAIREPDRGKHKFGVEGDADSNLLKAILTLRSEFGVAKTNRDLAKPLTVLNAVNTDFDDILMLGRFGCWVGFRELECLSHQLAGCGFVGCVFANQVVHHLAVILVLFRTVPRGD